jgi:hypothetical protein
MEDTASIVAEINRLAHEQVAALRQSLPGLDAAAYIERMKRIDALLKKISGSVKNTRQ